MSTKKNTKTVGISIELNRQEFNHDNEELLLSAFRALIRNYGAPLDNKLRIEYQIERNDERRP